MTATKRQPAAFGQPFLGYGVGLRKEHFDTIWQHADRIDFLEVLVENVMAFGGRPRDVVRRAAREFPVVLHGVALSIGGPDTLNLDYLDHMLTLIDEIEPMWFSDHLCFSSAFGVEYHDLIPLPFTEEALDHVAERIRQVQRLASIPFLIENPSYYIAYGASEMDEATFLTRVIEAADCGLLLDVNNVYVNSVNHGYDAREFIDALPLERVAQIHLAGHTVLPDVIIDTHGGPVIEPVLDLYRYTLERTGPVSTLLEWDNDIPGIEVLVAENERIRRAGREVLGAIEPWTREGLQGPANAAREVG